MESVGYKYIFHTLHTWGPSAGSRSCEQVPISAAPQAATSLGPRGPRSPSDPMSIEKLGGMLLDLIEFALETDQASASSAVSRRPTILGEVSVTGGKASIRATVQQKGSLSSGECKRR